MKLKVEIDSGAEEEIVIRVRELDGRTSGMIDQISRMIFAPGELAVSDGERDVFVRISDCLYFDTCDGRVAVHTADGDYFSQLRLFELAEILPKVFVRASKASIVNTAKISSISRSLTGVAEVGFFGTRKTAPVSRMYYHSVKDIIEETRLAK